MTSKDKFFIFLIMTFTLAFLAISFYWRSNSYYSNAYQQKSDRYRHYQEEMGKSPSNSRQVDRRRYDGSSLEPARRSSNEPEALGFKEKEIEKKSGRRYQTF